jgi:hypothetical protein
MGISGIDTPLPWLNAIKFAWMQLTGNAFAPPPQDN